MFVVRSGTGFDHDNLTGSGSATLLMYPFVVVGLFKAILKHNVPCLQNKSKVKDATRAWSRFKIYLDLAAHGSYPHLEHSNVVCPTDSSSR